MTDEEKKQVGKAIDLLSLVFDNYRESRSKKGLTREAIKILKNLF